METSETSINYQNESSTGAASTTVMTNLDAQTARPVYTVPGILHYLQHEWNRFEIERQQWDTERAELQARIAFLQGERQGQENLKAALVRRIKMLEYALKQERSKFNKLKCGNENLPPDEHKQNLDEDENKEESNVNFAGNNVTFKQGRQLLRQYLKEIGYVDTIIDIRSTAVKKLLGIKSEPELNGETKGKRAIPNLVKNVHNEFEKSLTSLGFLGEEKIDDEQNEEDFDPQKILVKTSPKNGNTNGPIENLTDFESEEAALHEFDFLSGDGSLTNNDKANTDWQVDQIRINRMKEDYRRDRHVKQHGTMTITNSNSATIRNSLSNPNNDELNNEQLDTIFRNSKNFMQDTPMEALDELARVTVMNDNEVQYDNGNSALSDSRKNWLVKFVLRSHFDAIRCTTFHPVESLLITGSEDRTLKLWNLDKAAVLRKSNSTTQDLEPIYTFRRHSGPVLSVAMNPTGEQFYSGGLDSLIYAWNLPNPEIDPYDSYDSSIAAKNLEGHTDAVWQLVVCGQKLLSSSADGTVRIWDTNLANPLQSTIQSDSIPISVDWIMQDTRQFVVTYDNLKVVVYDSETQKIVQELRNENVDPSYRINRLISHPNQGTVITGHDDRHIRFYDLQSGSVVHSMVAHLDAVTCLAIDPQQNCLVSGSHDRSIRLWHLEKRNCLQDINGHQKKDDDAVHDVAFHSTKPFLASVGADSIAKIYA